MLRTSLLSFVLLASASVLSAQTHVSAGLGFGFQPYESQGESPRALPSADLLVHRNHIGAHAGLEVGDLPDIGNLFAIHLDAVYRWGDRTFMMIGAGPTIINTGSSDTTWNAEGEVGQVYRRMEFFLRARHYDYSIVRSRDRPASPSGLAITAGVRFKLRG